MLLKAIREGLGRVIIFVDFVTRPKKLQRSPAEQNAVEQWTQQMSLYQFHACPFCVKVRRAMHRLNIPVELRDAQNDPEHRETLRTQGGEIKVPCLRIEENDDVTWMYESSDIIAYLERRFDPRFMADNQPLKQTS
ncbi:MAG: glutathione S-transferase N-terminal domain-containing protein [Pseudomonadota bacterium]